MSAIIVGARLSDAKKRRAARIAEAVAYLDEQLGGRRWTGRAAALRSIERAPNARKEAERLAAWHHRQWARTPDAEPVGRKRGKATKAKPAGGSSLFWSKTHTDTRSRPDHSDVQELRVKIANRDGALACSTTKRMLARLDRDIARGRLTPEQFAKRAAEIMRTPQAWPKDVIKDEIGAHTIEAAPVDQLAAGRAADAPLYRDRFAFLHRSPGGGRQLVTTAP